MSLILLVGGSFTVAGMINNAKDLNAKNDLDKIAVAEAAVQSSGGKYLAYIAAADGTIDGFSSKDSSGNYLNQSSIGFTLSSAVDVINDTNAGGAWSGSTWVAVVKSGTGKYFYRTADSSKITQVAKSDLESKFSLLDVTGSSADFAVY